MNLDDTKYLSNLNEDSIYELYKPIIRLPHSEEFIDFNQYHRDAYLRLKLREISYVQNPPPISYLYDVPHRIDSGHEEVKLDEEELLSSNRIQSIDKKIVMMHSFHDQFEARLQKVQH